MPTALITGITGQDGAYLAQLLLDKGYEVVGMMRRSASSDVVGERLRWLGMLDRVRLIDGNLIDLSSLLRILHDVKPGRGLQPCRPELRRDLLAAAAADRRGHRPRRGERAGGAAPRPAAGALLPGLVIGDVSAACRQPRQSETTPFYPRSPYAVAKLYAHWMTVNYRESFGLHASSGILFNHESPLRGIEFVTRKVTDGVARIKLGLAQELPLGNLDAQRDWGHARDYVRAMWLMLQQDAPDDYVVATGRAVSIREMVRIAFACAGLEADAFVRLRQDLLRPAEVDFLRGRRDQGADAARLGAHGDAGGHARRDGGSRPRPSPRPHGLTRRSAPRRDQREACALRIDALDDPASARHLHRSVDDLPAVVADAPRRGVNGIDVEVVEPVRRGRVGHLRHHAADRHAAGGEDLIDAHRAHIHRIRLGPAEQP